MTPTSTLPIATAPTSQFRMVSSELPEPQFTANGFFTAIFWPMREKVGVTEQVTAQVEAVLQAAAQATRSREELQVASGIKHREHFRKAYLEPLLGTGWLAMTIPDKPRSPKQRYRTTDLGLTVLSQRRRGE